MNSTSALLIAILGVAGISNALPGPRAPVEFIPSGKTCPVYSDPSKKDNACDEQCKNPEYRAYKMNVRFTYGPVTCEVKPDSPDSQEKKKDDSGNEFTLGKCQCNFRVIDEDEDQDQDQDQMIPRGESKSEYDPCSRNSITRERNGRTYTYNIPSCSDDKTIMAQLDAYDSDEKSRNDLVDDIISKKFMPQTKVDPSTSVFDIDGAAGSASTSPDMPGKETAETVLLRGKGGDLSDVQPVQYLMSSISEDKIKADDREFKYLRAISRAFARISSGKAYLVFNDQSIEWEETFSKSGDNQSIFVSDIMPELETNGKVNQVVRICPEIAIKWNFEWEAEIELLPEGSVLDCSKQGEENQKWYGEIIYNRKEK